MSRATAWCVHLSALLVGGTGLVYAWMRYLCAPADEWSLVNHPWEPDVKTWHLLTAPLLVFAVGLVWRAHVWVRLRSGSRPRRRTGVALALAFLPMVLSGYLLQVAVDENWRTIWIWTHAVFGIGWAPIYLIHQLGGGGRGGRALPPTSS